jgi:acetylornithine deacetylase
MPQLSTEDILERLVAFDTTSSRSNVALIDWVESYVRDLGIEPVRVPDPVQDKASLFFTVGPKERGGICLSGHTDVVPVAGQAWTNDPFTLTERDGRLYGRGACDMKGFIACCLAKLPKFLAAPLATPIHVLLSYDEEITCEGVLHTIRRFGQDLPKPLATIVGEPTEMQVANAHKSCAGFVTEVTGKEYHSSQPEQGASAVVAGAMLVVEINRLAQELMQRGDPTGRFDPPYSTIHVGTFSGGTARNIIAKQARFHWEFRGLPNLDPEEVPRRVQAYAAAEVLPFLRRTAPLARIETVREFTAPAIGPEPDSLAERSALRFTGSNRTITVGFATEGGQFQKAGIATVICGPGSIDQAHQPDEWIATGELRRCERFLDELATACAKGHL